MGDLEFTTVARDFLATANLTGKCVIYKGDFLDGQVYLFMNSNGTVMVSLDVNSSLHEIKNCANDSNPVKIVGSKRKIFFLNNEGNLYNLELHYDEEYQNFTLQSLSRITWKKFDILHFTKVLAITDTYQEGFICLGIDKDGKKRLKMFHDICMEDVKEYIFNDLNATPSNDYYIKAVETMKEKQDSVSLIISDRFTGSTYLCQENGTSSLIHCTKFQLVSVISIPAQNCLLLCFENGKLFIHFFSQSCPDCFLFLNKRIICIEKCSCKEGCLLWSDGAILHHTEINFDEDGIKMRNFQIQNNITGIISLIKDKDSLFGATINNIYYNINVGKKEKKELVQTPDEILSQIYSESLKIKDLQKNIQNVYHYAQCKQMIQNNQMCVKLNSEGNFLILKNMSKMTLEKQFWKIELRMSDQGCERVKVVELDTDIVDGMMYKFQNPFTKNGRVRVYLSGTFECETLSACIGTIGEDDDSEWKKNLKKKLDEIRLLYNPNT